MTDPQQIHRAASSLRRAIKPGPDDFAHPDHEDLVAFADGSLGDIDRELVQSHIALCTQCAEDVKDIADLREQLLAQPRASRNTWKYFIGAAAAIAAGIVLVVTFRQPETQAVTKEASTSPAPSASPRETALKADELAIVDSAIAAGKVDVPSNVRALTGSVGQLLGSDTVSSALLPMSPSGTVVESVSPQFSWQPIKGALTYRVAVFDDSFREMASSGQLTAASWTSPVALPASVQLAWQVTAHMADGSTVLAPAPPRPEARFVVLDRTAAGSIAELRSRLADQPMALGILLAKAGLLDDAAREFERAAKQPEQAALASKLRASLRSEQ